MSPPSPGHANGALLAEDADAKELAADAWAGVTRLTDRGDGLREAEELSSVLVVSVEVRDDGSRRSYIYKSLSSAERCVDRARKRGRDARVTLCELRPLGAVTVL